MIRAFDYVFIPVVMNFQPPVGTRNVAVQLIQSPDAPCRIIEWGHVFGRSSKPDNGDLSTWRAIRTQLFYKSLLMIEDGDFTGAGMLEVESLGGVLDLFAAHVKNTSFFVLRFGHHFIPWRTIQSFV